jgi:hypothetical protein
MLQNLSEEIRECLLRAEECKRLSKTALTLSAIKDYLDMEQRWLNLARSLNLQKGCRDSQVIVNSRANGSPALAALSD